MPSFVKLTCTRNHRLGNLHSVRGVSTFAQTVYKTNVVSRSREAANKHLTEGHQLDVSESRDFSIPPPPRSCHDRSIEITPTSCTHVNGVHVLTAATTSKYDFDSEHFERCIAALSPTRLLKARAIVFRFSADGVSA